MLLQQYGEAFERAAKSALEQYSDLAEDLADRNKGADDVGNVYKEITKMRRVVRAQAAFFSDPPTDASLNQLKTLFSSIRPAAENVDYSRDPDYSAFKERLWTISNPDAPMPNISQDGEFVQEADTDFSVTAAKEQLVCPISLKTFVDPHRAYGHLC